MPRKKCLKPDEGEFPKVITIFSPGHVTVILTKKKHCSPVLIFCMEEDFTKISIYKKEPSDRKKNNQVERKKKEFTC